MWIINNSSELQDSLLKNGRNLKTYDFSTLYTSISHDKLKDKLNQLITKAFKGMNKKYIKVNKYQAIWMSKGKGPLISCNLLIEMIGWLIDNTYVTIGNTVFQQVIGIPMGTDCAPYLANLFLFAYEFDFLNSTLKKKDFATLHKFKKCHRYIDDLLAVNNDGILDDYKDKIYPPELKLTSEDKNNKEVNYLDLHLKIEKSTINYRLYDKRDNFGFNIVNFPNLTGNIPTTQSYGVFISQLVRYARCCQNLIDFKERTLSLVERLKKQGFKFPKLCKTFTKFTRRYPHLLKKYKDFYNHDLCVLLKIGDNKKHSPSSLKTYSLICYHF